MKELTGNADGSIAGLDADHLPDCVHNVLANWDEVAFAAYDLYVKHGRVSVIVEPDDNDPLGATLSGYRYEDVRGYLSPEETRLIEIYDPDWEFVIQFTDTLDRMRTQRLRTAPGGRHPRRVWYFEMMRRLQEEPETVDLITLPGWFIESLERLEAMSKAREAENRAEGKQDCRDE